jgi:hypothetical protein
MGKFFPVYANSHSATFFPEQRRLAIISSNLRCFYNDYEASISRGFCDLGCFITFSFMFTESVSSSVEYLPEECRLL